MNRATQGPGEGAGSGVGMETGGRGVERERGMGRVSKEGEAGDASGGESAQVGDGLGDRGAGKARGVLASCATRLIPREGPGAPPG